MGEATAIVTLCIGQTYASWWDKYASRSWRAYAEKHNYALEILREPIDRSNRGATRPAYWQKCQILTLPSLKKYDRIIWLDSDIVINDSAPAVASTVPVGKIGCVVSGDYLQREMKAIFIERMRQKKVSANLDVDALWAEDQRYFLLKDGIDSISEIVQAGVLVLGHEHRKLLEDVYLTDYSNEQGPLSAEIIKHGLLHRIDSRFNMVFFERMVVHYPYLLTPNLNHGDYLAHLAVMTEYANSFFLHFAYQKDFARFLHPSVI